MVTHRLQCVYLPVWRANISPARKIPLNHLGRSCFERFEFPSSLRVFGHFATSSKPAFPFNIKKSRGGTTVPGCDFLFMTIHQIKPSATQ